MRVMRPKKRSYASDGRSGGNADIQVEDTALRYVVRGLVPACRDDRHFPRFGEALLQTRQTRHSVARRQREGVVLHGGRLLLVAADVHAIAETRREKLQTTGLCVGNAAVLGCRAAADKVRERLVEQLQLAHLRASHRIHVQTSVFEEDEEALRQRPPHDDHSRVLPLLAGNAGELRSNGASIPTSLPVASKMKTSVDIETSTFSGSGSSVFQMRATGPTTQS